MSSRADAFTAVAEPQRRAILDLLAPGERSVGDIAGSLRLAQPSVSKHLHVLSDVDLVRSRRDGRQVLYRINAGALRPLHEWSGKFERYWSRQLERIKERAERSTK
jgi:DNA-binding transcriptional ArsR family regulator